jgi:hypothetical protein
MRKKRAVGQTRTVVELCQPRTFSPQRASVQGSGFSHPRKRPDLIPGSGAGKSYCDDKKILAQGVDLMTLRKAAKEDSKREGALRVVNPFRETAMVWFDQWKVRQCPRSHGG